MAEWVLLSWACNFVLSKVIFKMYKCMNHMTTRTKGPYFGNDKNNKSNKKAMSEYEVCDMTIQVQVNS